MQAKIKEQYKKLFNPTFRITVAKQPVDVSLYQAENQAEKWALTPIIDLYEDKKTVLESALKRKKPVKPVKLDMNTQTRGLAFSEGFGMSGVIAKFKEAQKANLDKIKRRMVDEVTEKKTKKNEKEGNEPS